MPSRSPGRGARVVAETEYLSVGGAAAARRPACLCRPRKPRHDEQQTRPRLNATPPRPKATNVGLRGTCGPSVERMALGAAQIGLEGEAHLLCHGLDPHPASGRRARTRAARRPVMDAGLLDDGRFGIRIGGGGRRRHRAGDRHLRSPPLLTLEREELSIAGDPGWSRSIATALRGCAWAKPAAGPATGCSSWISERPRASRRHRREARRRADPALR